MGWHDLVKICDLLRGRRCPARVTIALRIDARDQVVQGRRFVPVSRRAWCALDQLRFTRSLFLVRGGFALARAAIDGERASGQRVKEQTIDRVA